MDIDEFQVTPLRLGNLARLAQRLQISQARLKALAESAHLYYEPFDLAAKSRWFSKKEPKKPRPIDRPTGELVALQSRINSELLSPILMPEHFWRSEEEDHLWERRLPPRSKTSCNARRQAVFPEHYATPHIQRLVQDIRLFAKNCKASDDVDNL